MNLNIIDPTGVHWRQWLPHNANREAFGQAVQGLPGVDVKIGVYEMVMFRNPQPHKVTPILMGDRLAVVAFIGLAS
jgi:hypothetical protein